MPRPDTKHYSATVLIALPGRPKKAVKNVHAPKRRNRLNDRRTIGKMEAFDPAVSSPPSVGIPPPPFPASSPLSSSTITHPSTPTKAANDNRIQKWATTSDLAKVYAACVALQLDDGQPVAFTFNLSDEALKKAAATPTRLIDDLKRKLDRELVREFGVVPLYWFALDIVGREKRLHLHGAFATPGASLSHLRRMRAVMRKAWGNWDAPGVRKQILFKTLYSAGWASYAMDNQRPVSKIVGERTFTITTPLRREAKIAHETIRSIMRGEDDPLLASYDPGIYF